MIVGLVSSFREGRLVRGAIETALEGCDSVLVYDGPVGQATEPTGDESDFRKLPPGVLVKRGEWASDAAKRTAMVQWVQARYGPQGGSREVLWGVWVDGDELLCNGRYLPDYLRRVEQDDQAGGWVIRIVELQDGSIARAPCRVFRLDAIDHFVHGAYQVVCKGSPVVLSLPNVPESDPQWQRERAAYDTMFMRPPLPGEPHLVHRAFLRPDADRRQRLHTVEGAEAESDLLRFGLRV